MKIRIKASSIRLRLTKSEVEEFSEKGLIRETTQFSNKSFTCVLKFNFYYDAISTNFPKGLQKAWALKEVSQL
ncbi:DUF7009 family protein [Croceitalea rosinachiae]|uniref:Uncharacterized protein n=1 Tax=Croceitalea rosinachiae TaxID=3075596 RepID=A0ABU3A840_9FLAO|nr:hypothetical protein [Croceitalea sp. F388]MDT0606336.1 hypothetical protein [Croceitalea sp. F388]